MSTQTTEALQAEIDRLKLQLDTLSTEDHTKKIHVGQYLLSRLSQLGVKSIFGVPGDFNLGFLDMVEDHPDLEWIGNCNELNASYAADGYARVNNTPGVLITTFGVGELSACNGVAGAFSEMVPMIHIAGTPSTTAMKNKPLLHHTLGDGRFDAYTKASEQFTIAQAALLTKETAAAEIDRVLIECLTHARPVYITLPTDIAYEKISSERLKIPLSGTARPNEPETENFVIDAIAKLVEEAGGDVVTLVDVCALRHNAVEEVRDFVNKTQFPVFCAPMAKGLVEETHERYGGLYVGSISRPEAKEKVEKAKLVLAIGSLKSDFNSGNFTYSIPTNCMVELHSTHTQIQYATYQNIAMKELLPKLTAKLESYQASAKKLSVPKYTLPVPKEDNDIISHSWFWPRMGEFFKPSDVVIAETGTSSFGVLDVPFPKGAVFLSQILWGSIGWTGGATLGAAIAARDRKLGRTILFIGDGSLQLTVQELSTMIRNDLKPILFVLNNKGYTIERYLHGPQRKYNDIMNWKYSDLLRVLGDLDGTKSRAYTVNTKDELSKLLDTSEFASADKIQLVEVMMDVLDAPRGLKLEADLAIHANRYADE